MISIKHFRKVDLLVILLLSFLWSGLAYIITFYFPFVFEIVLLSIGLFATLTDLLVKKIGSVTLFFSLAGITVSFVPLLGFIGFGNLLALVIMGAIFETTAYVFKKYASLLIAATVSNSSLPWLIFWLGKPLTASLDYALWNFTIISSLLGLLGALVGLVIWYMIRNSKLILRFKYG